MLDRILAGMKVIDLTQNVAGPFCTQVLGDLGAEVIKIERPGKGDDSRAWRSAEPGSQSPHFLAMNRNKRSICIDLACDDGKALVRTMAKEADILVHALKPASARKLGLDYDTLAGQAPRLIHCAISAYGSTGPLGDLPGYDPVMQAFTGLMSLTGNEHDAPARIPVSILDIGAGLWAALGIVSACLERMRTGRGVQVETSLLETGLSWLAPLTSSYLLSGAAPRRMGTAMGNAAPYELFESTDGHLFLAAPNDMLFAHACRALGCPALSEDPRFCTNAGRLANRQALHDLLQACTVLRTTAENVAALRAAGVPCGELNSLPQALAHPQVQALEMHYPAPLPGYPSHRSTGLPLRMDGRRSQPARPAPGLGADTEEILRESGLGPAAIEALRKAGVVA